MDLPTKFGQYTLLKRVASGGMAEIWRAQIRGPAGFRRDVAIKTIHAQHSDETEFIKMLLDEARIAASLVHPHIAQVLNCGSIDGIHFIAMEFVHGHALSWVLQRMGELGEQFALQECLHISISLLRALGHAHRQVDDHGEPMGIVHRDVSPHNLMLSYGGAVKLVDFGVARAANKLHKTETGVIRGKVAYMAPEHLDGKPVDHRSDLFAAALVTLELISNRRAYSAETSSELIKKVLMGEIRNINEMLEGVPATGKLAPILERALSVDKEARYPTCEAMASELGQVLNDIDPSFHEEALGEHLQQMFSAEYEQDKTDLRAIESRLADTNTDDLAPISFGNSATIPVTTATTQPDRPNSGRRKWIALVATLFMAVGGAIAAAVLFAGPELGSLRIVTSPPGASVTVDGVEQPGQTPTTIPDIEVGADVEIVATLADHRQAKRSYRMGRGTQELNFELTSLMATVRITGAAPEVNIHMGEAVVGKTDAAGGLDVVLSEADSASISIPRIGGAPYTTTLELVGGQTHAVSVPPVPRVAALKRRTRKSKDTADAATSPTGEGTLNVACLPWCEIRVDGQQVKDSPLRALAIAAGVHTVEVVNPPSGKKDKKKVTILAGERKTLRFRLK